MNYEIERLREKVATIQLENKKLRNLTIDWEKQFHKLIKLVSIRLQIGEHPEVEIADKVLKVVKLQLEILAEEANQLS